jgi:hypothetical protein
VFDRVGSSPFAVDIKTGHERNLGILWRALTWLIAPFRNR